MDSLFKFAKKLLEALSKYACCVCSKKDDDDDDESNDRAVTSLRSPPDSSKINNGVLMRSTSLLDNSQNIKQSESPIKENISEELEKNLNIQNEMDGLKSMTTKVGNGFKGLTDTITSKTRNIKNKGSGDSFKKITEKLHIKPRKSGGKSPDNQSKFDRIKRYSHKLADKARCNKRSNHEIDPDSRPSFGKRRSKVNSTVGISEFNASFIDTIDSESVRY